MGLADMFAYVCHGQLFSGHDGRMPLSFMLRSCGPTGVPVADPRKSRIVKVSVETQRYRSTEEPTTADSVLVHRALAGDQKAFEELVSRYRHSLFVLIYHYVGDCHEAQDILQQVWLQLYLSLGTLRLDMHIRPWIFTVARNCSLDVLRRKRLPSFSEVEAGNQDGDVVSFDVHTRYESHNGGTR